MGINWYTNFDHPEKIGTQWWIGRGALGSVRGGHALAVPRKGSVDPLAWWEFYNQGREGACVGFACSRAMSLVNRRRYAARWLWNEAKLVDGFADTNPGDDNGTTVSAGFDVLRTQGHRVMRRGVASAPAREEGILRNVWATSWADFKHALGRDDEVGVPLLNSWGRLYPHIVHMTDEAGERVFAEAGELGVIIDA